MSGYRRFIAYVYEYENGRKGESRGFIKVEAKNSVCRMNYKLTGIYRQEAVPAKIYAYVREKGQCVAFLLGNCNLSGMRVEFETETPENDVGGSGYKLGDVCGLILKTDSGEVYGSIWEDRPVMMEEIKIPEGHTEEKREEEITESEEERNMQAAEALEEIESESMAQEGEAENVLEERAEKKREPEEILGTVMWEETVRERKELELDKKEWGEKIQDTEMEGEGEKEIVPEEIEKEQADMERIHENGETAIQTNLHQTAFCDNGITQCRRITPGDFKILNRKDRGLLTNRFLRHGFSRYGHLLIGKREEDGKYILGVPGIYESQEALMAGMFGFPYFKETGGQNSCSRHFGYWYRMIDRPEEIS